MLRFDWLRVLPASIRDLREACWFSVVPTVFAQAVACCRVCYPRHLLSRIAHGPVTPESGGVFPSLGCEPARIISDQLTEADVLRLRGSRLDDQGARVVFLVFQPTIARSRTPSGTPSLSLR